MKSNYRFDVSSEPGVTPQLQALIDKVTQPRSRDRYPTAADLAQALQDLRSV
jgi:hypothetical protein